MPAPTLIILGGFAGAGKTTVARRLSAERNLPHFSTDEYIEAVRKELGNGFHEAAPTAFGIIWHIAEKHLKNGVSVILDANMCHQRTWESVDELAKRFPEVRILPIILECPLEVHRSRVEKRGIEDPEHCNLGGDAFEDVQFKYEFIRALDRKDLIRIDADRTPEQVYEAVRGILSAYEKQN